MPAGTVRFIENLRADSIPVAGIAQGLNVVKVSVADVRVENEVKLVDSTKWLDRTGGSPREMIDRHRIRSILGMPVAR